MERIIGGHPKPANRAAIDWEIKQEPQVAVKPASAVKPAFVSAQRPTSAAKPPHGSFATTDFGNAERLVYHHGKDMRFCSRFGWLLWSGNHWQTGADPEVEQRAKKTVRGIYEEASAASNLEERKRLSQWAVGSESAQRIRAMIRLAQTEPVIPIHPEQMDTQLWLLNCPNGTINLKTGDLRPNRREDLITKMAGAAYEQGAACPTFLRFLREIFAGDEATIRFLQRWWGYCLTGDMSEQRLVFGIGSGANGKSTLVNVQRAVMGDYAQVMPPDALMVCRDGTAQNIIARMRGARLIVTSELEEGKRLAEVAVKQLTGGDPVTGRFLYMEPFEFRPTAKLFMAGNHKPKVQGTDYAIWRRIVYLPFPVTIPPERQDKRLSDKLATELPGIFAWAVEGCLAWQRDGLNVPDRVVRATEGYRNEQDVLGSFLLDKCLLGQQFTISMSQLYPAYHQWCTENGEKELPVREFQSRLSEKGITNSRNETVRFWRGIGLRTEA